MSFWDNLGDLGNNIIEFAGDTVKSVGDNLHNATLSDAAMIERVKVNNQIALSQNEQDAKRADANQKLIQNAVYAVLGVAFIVICVWAVGKFLK